MSPMKALGSDGAHALFFQNYWKILGNDIVTTCLNVLNNGEDVKYLNKIFISLIPKRDDPKYPLDFRPISLCNVIYKTIAKTLANRMNKVLDAIISPNQSTFIPGRLITDNVIMGFECIHAINSKRLLGFMP